MSRRESTNATSTPRCYVGPYELGKTLGKGQTGLVKQAIHVVTKKKFAIKIINRERLSDSVLGKVEREIAIMKLLEHNHVLKLIDVYENKKNLYLILEHVSGGELFDYLVRKGRLRPHEARKFFKQIVSAVDFCHKHNVCHRDLKPENLLLDDRNNIKVADFGMASLQPQGNMLETSCGSPHYACPEVIRGDKYDGTSADVWSLGVILFALLVGALPFDDDNLRQLLEKVKKGVYHIPSFVPPEAQDLIRGMICCDPIKRLKLDDVLKHQWMLSDKNADPYQSASMIQSPCYHLDIRDEAELDPDVMNSMTSLGCFKDRQILIEALMSGSECTEKYVYQLLLKRKERHPSLEDDENKFPYDSSRLADRPRKRTDSTSSLNSLTQRSRKNSLISLQSQTNGRTTPSTPQRSASTHSDVTGGISRHRSASHTGSSSTSGSNRGRFTWSATNTPKTSPNHSAVATPLSSNHSSRGASPPNSPSWTKRIQNSIKNSFLGTPRFHRRKPSHPGSNQSLMENTDESFMSNSTSSDSEKKSWFKDVWNSVNQDQCYALIVDEQHPQKVKNLLIQILLSIPDLMHEFRHPNIIEISYQEKYSSMPFNLQKPFKAQVTIMRIHNNKFKVDFRLVSGNSKRFVRTFQKIQQYMECSGQQHQTRGGVNADGNMNVSSDLRMYRDELMKMCEDLHSQPVKQRPV